jgi:hypothetical protein
MDPPAGNDFTDAVTVMDQRPQGCLWKPAAKQLENLFSASHTRQPIVGKSYLMLSGNILFHWVITLRSDYYRKCYFTLLQSHERVTTLPRENLWVFGMREAAGSIQPAHGIRRSYV